MTAEVKGQENEIGPDLLAKYLKTQPTPPEKNFEGCLIVDCRNFVDYNDSHVKGAVNAFYSSIMRRRVLNDKTLSEGALNHLTQGLEDKRMEKLDLILYAGEDVRITLSHTTVLASNPATDCMAGKHEETYGENGMGAKEEGSTSAATSNVGFLRLLFEKLMRMPFSRLKFRKVLLLRGGFLQFSKRYPELCESSTTLGATSIAEALPLLSFAPRQGHYSGNLLHSQQLLRGHPIDGNMYATHQGLDNNERQEKFCVEGLPHDVRVEHQELAQRSASPSRASRCHWLGRTAAAGQPVISGTMAARRQQTPLKMPCSFSQPCFKSFQRCFTNVQNHQLLEEKEDSDSIAGPTQILDFLFLGSQQDALDPHMLENYGITTVINLSENCPRPDKLPADDKHFLRIPIKDSYCAKLLPHFDVAYNFIERVRRSDEKVLLHCLAGISRSATLAIAYIMRSKRMASDEAYKFVKEKRPSISPNFNFMGQLMEYERQLRDKHMLPPSSNRPYSFASPCSPPAAIGDRADNDDQDAQSWEKAPNIMGLGKSASVNFAPPLSLCSSLGSDRNGASSSPKTTPPSSPAPERPSQLLLKSSEKNGLLPPLRAVEEDVPSPSNEFSKLDISLVNPCFALPDNRRSASKHALSSQTCSMTAPGTSSAGQNAENPLFTSFNPPIADGSGGRAAGATPARFPQPAMDPLSHPPHQGVGQGMGMGKIKINQVLRSMLKRNGCRASNSSTYTDNNAPSSGSVNVATPNLHPATIINGSAPGGIATLTPTRHVRMERSSAGGNSITFAGKRKLRCKLSARCMAPAKLLHRQMATKSSTGFKPVLPTVVDEHLRRKAPSDHDYGGDEHFSDDDEGHGGDEKRWSPPNRLDKRRLGVGEDSGFEVFDLRDESSESGFMGCHHREKYLRQHHLSLSSSTSTTTSTTLKSSSQSGDTTSSSLEASCRDDADRTSIASSTSSLTEITVK